jgi:hypothetical protein
MGPAQPGRDEFWPVGDYHQHWHVLHPVDRKVEQLQGAGINPVCILQRHQERAPCRKGDQLVEKGGEGRLLLLPGCQLRG